MQVELRMLLMTDRRHQAITGLTPPALDEAVIRTVWPSVAASPGIATLGRLLMKTMILAPLGWMVCALPYFMKVVPGLGCRYVLTNRRIMRQKGMKYAAAGEVALADIDEIRLQSDSNNDFYRAATMEIVSQGRVALTLPGVPNAESFRHAILNAAKAWVPGKAAAMDKFVSAAAK
jgi:hypothetical protein